MINNTVEDDRKTRMGKIGETIFANFCSAKGYKIEVSIDPYDSKKDMIVDGLTTEVKTQVPYVYKNAFTFKPNQLKKCLTVERLIFVSVPNHKTSHHSDGKIYEIDPKKMQYYSYTTGDGRNMIAIPIDQLDMKELFTMSNDYATMLQKYSSSKWN